MLTLAVEQQPYSSSTPKATTTIKLKVPRATSELTPLDDHDQHFNNDQKTPPKRAARGVTSASKRAKFLAKANSTLLKGPERCVACRHADVDVCVVPNGATKCASCPIRCSLKPSARELDMIQRLTKVHATLRVLKKSVGVAATEEDKAELRTDIITAMEDVSYVASDFGGSL